MTRDATNGAAVCWLLAVACAGNTTSGAGGSGGVLGNGGDPASHGGAAAAAGRAPSTPDASAGAASNGGSMNGDGGSMCGNSCASNGDGGASGGNGGASSGTGGASGGGGSPANGGSINGDGGTGGSSGGSANGGAGGNNGRGGSGGSSPPIGTTEFCSTGKWCWQNPLPQGLELADAFALSSSDVWAVGYYGTALHYDGNEWRHVDTGTKGHLLTVLALSHDDVWAGGELGLIHWDGKVFAPVVGAPTEWVNALWASGPNDIWVSSQGGAAIEHYRGPSAGFAEVPVNAPSGVAWDLLGFGADDLWAVGDSGYFYRHQSGTWTSPAGNSAFAFYSVWGTSSSDLWLGSTDGRLVHWDGAKLKSSLLADPWWAHRVRGSGAGDIWAILSQSPASGVISRLGHFDGKSWTVLDPGGGGDFDAVSAIAPDDAWVVGHRGVMKHYDGKTFSADRTVSTAEVFALWAASDTDAWAVDSAGHTLHFDGSIWKASSTPAKSLGSVFGLGPNDVWAAGDQIVHYDGKSWTSLATSLSTASQTTIWARAADDVWVGGFSSSGYYAHYDGSKVNFVSPPSSFAVEGLWGFATDDVWSVGDYGNSEHWTGGVWADVATGVTDHLYAVWGSAPNDVWAVGAGGRMLRYRGLGWSIVSSPTTQDLHAIWGRAANDVYAAGSSGVVFHFDGTSWKPEDAGVGTDLNRDRFYAIGGGKAHTWAAGALGMILGK